MNAPGKFIVFEGGDGVGKTTQVELLAEFLSSPAGGGHQTLTTREPGGTPLGVQLREVIMHGEYVAPRAEALLYAADRAHHIATLVRPALAAGKIVIQDRYIDSSVVYQGQARGLGDQVREISAWAAAGLRPDLTIVLDGASHGIMRELDRLERDTAGQSDLIRTGFTELAAKEPERYAVVDATGTVAAVAERVRAAVLAKFPELIAPAQSHREA